MSSIYPPLFKRISEHPKIRTKFANAQVVRVSISKIKQENPGITSNAAAYLFAKKNKVSIFRYLSDEDKQSLSHAQFVSNQSQSKSKKNKKIQSKSIIGNSIYDPKLIREANANAEIYPYVYILENSLRNLILQKFNSFNAWWLNKNIVKTDIQEYAKKIQDAERKYKWIGKRGDHPIYYVGLEHLYKIIEMNFNPHFRDIFDLQNLRTWINECVSIRNLVAHNVRTEKTERDNIKIRTKYICNSINS